MYRGCKETYWEGGVRGAAFLHGKMLENPGRTSNQLMHISDWLPTLMTVIGKILSQCWVTTAYLLDVFQNICPSAV